MLSQYEPVLALDEPGGGLPLGERFHRGPPWVRTRVLHPLSLKPVEDGEVGILAHLDLANLGSVSAILTEDLGRLVPGGFILQGRNPGAEPRGCSLAMEDFLEGLEEETLREEGEDLAVSSVPNALVLFNPALDTTRERLRAHWPSPELTERLSPLQRVRPGLPPAILNVRPRNSSATYRFGPGAPMAVS